MESTHPKKSLFTGPLARPVSALLAPPEAAGNVSLRSPDALLLMVVVASAYLIGYLTHPAAPTLEVTFSGWLGWFDQGEYHKAARDLAALQLRPSHYWYGYPLLGAPFVALAPQHPFLIPNLAFVCGTVLCFHAVCRTLVSRLEAWILAFAVFCFDPTLWVDSLLVPWNSIPVYFAFFSTVWLTLFRGDRPCHWYFASAAIALAAFCRPPDLPILLVVYYSGLLLRKRTPGWWRFAAAPLCGAALVLVLQFGATFIVYGSFVSPYVAANSSVGFGLWRMPIKLYQWLVDPTLLTGADAFLPPGATPRGVLARLPHALLIAPGIAFIALRGGLRTLGVPLAVCPAVAIYLGFNAASYPPHYWSYMGYHHIWWFAPWVSLWAWLTISRAWRVLRFRTFALLVVLPLVAVSLFAYRAVVTFEGAFVRNPPADSRATPTTPIMRTTSDGLSLEAVIPAKIKVDAVRIRGTPALPFHASVAGSHFAFKVLYDERELPGFAGYFPLGSPEELVLSFMNAPLRARVEKPLTVGIRREGLEASQPQTIEYLSVRWHPGANLKLWHAHLSPARPAQPTPAAAPGLGSAELISGWSTGGPGYVWSVGKEATLRLRASPGRRITGIEFTSGAFVEQQVTVSLNGQVAGTVTVLDRKLHRIDLSPNPEGDKPYEISFGISSPTAPRDVGMNSDERLLGVELWTVDFVYQP